MSAEIPPPGAERDAEIAAALGWRQDSATGVLGPCSTLTAPADIDFDWSPSTAPAACDRLIDEMVRRGWMLCLQTMRPGGYYCRIDQRGGALSAHGEGPKIADAVSAAALLALRASR
jgi:hypothetical protein